MPTTPSSSHSPQQPLTVVLIDDSELATAGLEQILAPLSDRVDLVDTRTAIARPADLDVILYEPMGLSAMAGAMLRDLRAGSAAHVVAFSWADASRLEAPVAGPHLDKRLSASQLVRTLEELVSGRWTAPTPARTDAVVIEARPAVPAAGTRTAEPSLLTPRESDVVALVVAGRSNDEIARELTVSINSVKTYIRSAYRKMGVSRRSQAVLWGMTHGYQPDAAAPVATVTGADQG